ncbi:MAG: alpha-amylase family glycosyl hydrolase [Actinomycetota bacterium]
MASDGAPWWRDAVLYQIYPRSFGDANGDGVGDLQGTIQHLDHLEWLGIDGLWITPVMPSPNKDWGYDVAEYTGVHEDLGTLDDVDELVSEAAKRDISIIFDLVPNHTSDQHEWFIDARSARDARYRDFYVWADPKEDGSPPNNWISVFGGESAWELDEKTGQYYLHNFLKHQPDLDWWNDEVRDCFDEILRFWFDRGIAGFRIDVAHALIKDRELRDNLPSDDDDHERVRSIGQKAEYNMNRPEVHDIFRRWRKLCDGYDPKRILVGETFVMGLQQMAAYYGDGDDELNLAFNFPFALSDLDASELSRIVETTDDLIPPQGWPVWMASNHDVGRFSTRWCDDDTNKIKCVLMMLMTMRGTPFLYYGDEIGMPETKLPREQLKDPVGLRDIPGRSGRDPGRTPMHWNGDAGGGFSTGDSPPWLPVGDARSCNVADQRDDPSSILCFCRDLIAFRRSSQELRRAPYEAWPDAGVAWAWRRGDRYVVALNMSDAAASIADVSGTVALSTLAERAGQRVDGRAELAPWEGIVLDLEQGG